MFDRFKKLRFEHIRLGEGIIYIYIYIYGIPPQLSTFLGVIEGEIQGFRGQMPTCLGYFLVFASFNLCTTQPYPVFFIFHRWGT